MTFETIQSSFSTDFPAVDLKEFNIQVEEYSKYIAGLSTGDFGKASSSASGFDFTKLEADQPDPERISHWLQVFQEKDNNWEGPDGPEGLSECERKAFEAAKDLTNSHLNTKSLSFLPRKREEEIRPEKEVVLCIKVVPGPKYFNLSSSAVINEQFAQIHAQEFKVRSQERVSETLNQLYCPFDKFAHDELKSDEATLKRLEADKFLLIEDVFYDDAALIHEEDNETKYSRPSDPYFKAIKSIGCCNDLISDFQACSQESLQQTCWNDLKLRLNRPYLYSHLSGSCEHHLIVTQINAVSKAPSLESESLNTAARSSLLVPSGLPMKLRRRRCRVCDVYAATRLVVNDKLLHENPCAICESCHRGFHGIPLHEDDAASGYYSDFQVYPYYHEL